MRTAPPATAPEPTVTLPGGERWPALGLGTWRYGQDRARRAAEVAAIRGALEDGWRVIDTAEMYAEGGAERVVGEAVAGAIAAGVLDRASLKVVSKVYPHNATVAGIRAACGRSLERLRLDTIDLYLLHWRGSVPLAETLEGLLEVQRRGWIRHFGVSNFDTDDLEELFALDGGRGCAANQVYYSLGERGPEFDLLPWMQREGMPLMAYSPVDQGALLGGRAAATLAAIGQRHGATPAQVALAALLARPGVMPIPMSANPAHLRENRGAIGLALDADDLAAIDRAFPPPAHKRPLATT